MTCPFSKRKLRPVAARPPIPITRAFPSLEMQKPPPVRAGVSGLGSLTITYFHTGIRTIIGVESFHGPVRDGKGWDRLAMVIRQRGLLRCFAAQPILEEAVILSCVYHTRESNLSLWILRPVLSHGADLQDRLVIGSSLTGN